MLSPEKAEASISEDRVERKCEEGEKFGGAKSGVTPGPHVFQGKAG